MNNCVFAAVLFVALMTLALITTAEGKPAHFTHLSEREQVGTSFVVSWLKTL